MRIENKLLSHDSRNARKHEKNQKGRFFVKRFLLVIILLVLLVGSAYGYMHKHGIRVFFNQIGITKLTWKDVASIEDDLKTSKKHRAPMYNPTKLSENPPSNKYYNPQNGKQEDVTVWDSWPVTDKDGAVANYHGYRLVMGLTSKGARNDKNCKIGLYAQKIADNDTSLSSWQYLGDVFNTFDEGASEQNKDEYINKMKGEWSGSTVMLNADDSTLRVFYTNAVLDNNQSQALTTAQISVLPKETDSWDSGLVIDHNKTADKRTVFAGDGKFYQTWQQAKNKGDIEDSFAMRDPHLVIENGHYYLLFEGNTGTDYGYQGDNNMRRSMYYGNRATYKKALDAFKKDKSSNLYNKTYLSNATIGKIELNSDFTLKKVMKPVLSANATSDLIERPTVFKQNGKWYLFMCTYGDKLNSYSKQRNFRNVLLGYVSDNGFDGDYKPMNGNGLILASNNTPGFAYSYLPIKPKDNNENRFVVTAFYDARTFAASYVIKVDGNKSTVENNYVLDQGALTLEAKKYPAKPQEGF